MHRSHCFYITAYLRALYVDDENAMGSCGLVVFGCLAYDSIGISDKKIIQSVLLSLAVERLEVVQKQLAICSLSGLYFGQILQFFSDILSRQEIIACALINLHVADMHSYILRSLFALIENVTERSRNQSPIIIAPRTSSHRKCLTTTRLPIGKDGSIESLQCRIHYIFCNFIKYFLLFSIHIEDLIELESPSLQLIVNIALLWIFGNNNLCSISFLVDLCVYIKLLKPLQTSLTGLTLSIISIAEFLDIRFDYVYTN